MKTPINRETLKLHWMYSWWKYVLAVVLPETDRQTEVVPGEVVQNGNTVVMNYRVNKGAKTSYRMVPFAAIAIDKPVSDTQMEIYFKQTN